MALTWRHLMMSDMNSRWIFVTSPKKVSSAHGIWNSFVVESHQWNSTFALQVADWWCVWKGFRWGEEVRCVFGFTWSWTKVTNKLALRWQICVVQKLLISHLEDYTLCSCGKIQPTMGGSPNSAHQSIGPVRVDTSGGWQERSAIFSGVSCISCFETTYSWWKNSITIGKK